jgi:undecaprenyl-diphosphatase
VNEHLSAIVLGIVEGVTEFLPVSSTGHLILFGETISFSGPKAETFEIFIQLGAILAVVVLYFPRFISLLDFKAGEGFTGHTGLLKLAIGCIPAFILGAMCHKFIKEHLFGPGTVASALIVGAIIILIVEHKKQRPVTFRIEEISYRQAFAIGCCQCFALWPGMSRSASTIIGGMLCGLERKIAAEFSFLLAVPVMTAAVLFDLIKSRALLSSDDLFVFVIGFITSFVVAVLSVKFFLELLGKFTLNPFAYYRIGLGGLVLGLLYL